MTSFDRNSTSRLWRVLAERRGVLRRLQAGAHLYRQGDSSDFVFLVARGLVKLTLTGSDGDETLLSIRSAGELVGLEPINSAPPRQASAVCVDEVEGWSLSASAVTHVLAETPALYRDIVWELARTNAEFAARLSNHATSVHQRLARLLVQYATRIGTPDQDGIRLPALTQAELASAVGVSRRVIERALSRLRDHGMVNLGYRQIIIRDLPELRRVAGTAAIDENLPPPDARILARPASERPRTLKVSDQQASVTGARLITPLNGGFVEVGGERYDLAPDTILTFGRSPQCTVCLDASDLAISRQAGQIFRESDVWWVVNTSSVRPLAVIDDLGLRSVLPPGRRAAVEGPTRVQVDGAKTTYFLYVYVPNMQQRTEPTSAKEDPVSASIQISDSDKLALTALFAGYLEEGDRYDPHPRSYEAAAMRLGWSRTTLVKRIEYLRTRLDKVGVPAMMGPNALSNLAEYVLAVGILRKDDLRILSTSQNE